MLNTTRHDKTVARLRFELAARRLEHYPPTDHIHHLLMRMAVLRTHPTLLLQMPHQHHRRTVRHHLPPQPIFGRGHRLIVRRNYFNWICCHCSSCVLAIAHRANYSVTRLFNWVISGTLPEDSIVTLPPVRSAFEGSLRVTVAFFGSRSTGAFSIGVRAFATTLPARSRTTTVAGGASTAPRLWTVTVRPPFIIFTSSRSMPRSGRDQ